MTDMAHHLRGLTRAIEDVMVSSSGILHDLSEHHEKSGTTMPPFWTDQGDLGSTENERTSLAVAMKFYGPGVMFNLNAAQDQQNQQKPRRSQATNGSAMCGWRYVVGWNQITPAILPRFS